MRTISVHSKNTQIFERFRLLSIALISIWSISGPYPVNAQENLVPNPGFFEVTECPEEGGQVDLAYPWECASWACSSDLFHICSTDPRHSVPNSRAAVNLTGRTTDAYAGIGTSNPGDDTGEYIQSPLKRNLRGQAEYFVRFWVSPGVMGQALHNDGIGLMFSDTGLFTPLWYRMYMEPDIDNNYGMIDDSTTWVPIYGLYKAQGNEGYITLGNFKTRKETNFRFEGGGGYMLIDDVGVYPTNLFPDTIVLCSDSTLLLDATFLEADHEWNTGDTTESIFVDTPGLYAVSFSLYEFTFRDTVRVIYEKSSFARYESDTSICEGDSLILTGSYPGNYSWSTQDTTQYIVIRQKDNYLLEVTDGCSTVTHTYHVATEDCTCDIFIPNVFTPNDDGIADRFTPFPTCDYFLIEAELIIFDRWGNEFFNIKSSNLQALSWDGQLRGQLAAEGVYFYQLSYHYQTQQGIRSGAKRGNMTLLR